MNWFTFRSAPDERSTHGQYQHCRGKGWTALLGEGVDVADLSPEESDLVLQVALATGREGRILVVEATVDRAPDRAPEAARATRPRRRGFNATSAYRVT